MHPDPNSMVTLASSAAREAGKRLRNSIAEWNHVTSDKQRDLKLGADRQSEEIILAILRGGSNYPVLSEEIGEIGQLDPQGYRWIVDPLDGSVNYHYGLPIACVSIALWQGATPCCGVVYDFWRDELFHAARGFGTFLNEEPTAVTATTSQDQAIIATGFPAPRDFSDEALRKFTATLQNFRKVRLLGSAALSLAYVASGRVDAYHEEDIMLWDVAAGLALVNSAGGYISIQMSNRVPNACRVFAAAHRELVPTFLS